VEQKAAPSAIFICRWQLLKQTAASPAPDTAGRCWGATAIRCVIRDDFTPLLIGENPLDNERLWTKLNKRLQTVGRTGVVNEAQAAVDLALWDIKGKAAGMPVYKLLGGTRESAPVYGSDGGWLYMSVEEMVAAFEEYLSQGMMGVKMKLGHEDPRIDIQRVTEVRKALGDDIWITTDANQKWDYPTAMMVGRELEQLNVAWFEEPLWCDDIPGHARLADAFGYTNCHGRNTGFPVRIRCLHPCRRGRYPATGHMPRGRHNRNDQDRPYGASCRKTHCTSSYDGKYYSGCLRYHVIRSNRIHALGIRRFFRADAN
jgi:hypothetical protein